MARTDWTDPLGAGISLLFDCSRNIKSTSGPRKVLEAIVGRLTDELFYSDDYGFPLAQSLRRVNPIMYGQVAAAVETELLKDDRITQVECEITYSDSTKTVEVLINVTLSTDDTFALIGNVNLLTSEQIRFNGI